MVRGAAGRAPPHACEARARDGHGQSSAHGRWRVERHTAHRARLWLRRVSRARGSDDRHRSARQRRAGTAALRSPLFRREPARRRASWLQQRRADGEARDGGSRRQAGARRCVELSLRSCEGRYGEGRGPVRCQLPDAEPSRLEPAHDLHGHRLGADARDDRAAPAAHRAEGRRRAHAVLRGALAGGATLLRAAHEAAARLHRHQPRLFARPGSAQAIRAGPDPHARRRCRSSAARRALLRVRMRTAQHGARRHGSACAISAGRADSTGTCSCRSSAKRGASTWKPTDGLRRPDAGPRHRLRHGVPHRGRDRRLRPRLRPAMVPHRSRARGDEPVAGADRERLADVRDRHAARGAHASSTDRSRSARRDSPTSSGRIPCAQATSCAARSK